MFYSLVFSRLYIYIPYQFRTKHHLHPNMCANKPGWGPTPTPEECFWDPYGDECGFTKALGVVQMQLSSLYERTKLSEDHPLSLKQLFAPYRKKMLHGLTVGEKSRYITLAGGKPMNFVDIINRVNNCFYGTAEDVQADLENMFACEIKFHGVGDKQMQAEKARHVVRKAIKFSSILPDDGVLLPQCELNMSCRKPNGHDKRCMDSWYGPCRRPLFKDKMTLPPPPSQAPDLTACSVMARLVRWHAKYKFDKAVLEILCSRSLCNMRGSEHAMQWYTDLRELEAAVAAGNLSQEAFLSSLLECAILAPTHA